MEDDYMTLLYASPYGLTTMYDTIGDGQVDMVLRLNDPLGDSGYSMALDTDANGIPDTFYGELDMDGDGYAETLFMGNDYDQDGSLDVIKAYIDTNIDGNPDAVMTIRPDVDTEGNDVIKIVADMDLTGDHSSDLHYEDVIPANSAFPSDKFQWGMMGSACDNGLFDPETPEEFVAGNPAQDMEVWECQGQTNRCALYSQKFAIEQLTGQEIDIEEFARTAEENGWFSEDDGTKTLNMNKMLVHYGIDHDMQFDCTMEQLETELRNGNKIIVSVDSGQIWHGEANDIFSPATQSDHALQVVGIDYSDPQNPMVVLNDSGTPMGRGEMVPYDTFENAWSAGDHQMIVCRA